MVLQPTLAPLLGPHTFPLVLAKNLFSDWKYGKCLARNPGSLDHDHFMAIISSL
jgi:hypothetical protein